MLRRTPAFAQRRYESTEEKVKGAVIGIDLGEFFLLPDGYVSKRSWMLTMRLSRHNKLCCRHHGGQDPQDH